MQQHRHHTTPAPAPPSNMNCSLYPPSHKPRELFWGLQYQGIFLEMFVLFRWYMPRCVASVALLVSRSS